MGIGRGAFLPVNKPTSAAPFVAGGGGDLKRATKITSTAFFFEDEASSISEGPATSRRHGFVIEEPFRLAFAWACGCLGRRVTKKSPAARRPSVECTVDQAGSSKLGNAG